PVQRYSDDDVGLIFWGFGRYMGAPLYQNPQGEILGHVYDHGRTYGNIDVRGYETKAYLPYHTDAGDMVGLLCLRRGIEGGLSSIVSSTTAHNEIAKNHPEYLGLLYNGYYYIRREAALTERGISDKPIPVFGHKDGVVSCRYIRNQINAGTEEQVKAYERDGCLSPVRAMSAERAAYYRAKYEALEARVNDDVEIKKMKTKSHLLCPWVLEIAEDPFILDCFEDLIGPNI